MTPIPAVVTVDTSEDVETALRRCISSGHTRLRRDRGREPGPRARDRALELARAAAAWPRARTPTIEPLVRDAPIVPETKPLDDLLADLQRQRSLDGRRDRRVRPRRRHRHGRGHHRGGRRRDRRRDRPRRRRGPPAGERRLVRPRPRRGDRPARLRARAAGRHRRLQLGRRLRVRRARAAAQARRHDHAPTATRSASSRCARTASRRCGSASAARCPSRAPPSSGGERRRAQPRPGQGRSKFPAGPALEPADVFVGRRRHPQAVGRCGGYPRAVDRGGPPSGRTAGPPSGPAVSSVGRALKTIGPLAAGRSSASGRRCTCEVRSQGRLSARFLKRP